MTRRLPLVLAVVFCSLFPIAAAVAETPLQTLDEGLGLFREAASAKNPKTAHALYAEALLRFNLLVSKDGVRNGKIFYDIGNTYYRLGDIARAILSYRRALLYRPRDPNLEHNLAYVRSKRRDRLRASLPVGVMRAIFFWHYTVSLRLQLALFLGFFASIWVLLSVRLLAANRGAARRIPGWSVAVAAIVATAFLGSLVWRQIDLDANRGGVIVASSIVARKGDARSYDATFKHPLHAGTEFTLVSVRPAWYHIMLSNGVTTWIPQSSARLVRPVTGG